MREEEGPPTVESLCDVQGMTALHTAVRTGSKQVFDVLLRAQADVRPRPPPPPPQDVDSLPPQDADSAHA